MKPREIGVLLIFVIACELAGAIGTIATVSNIATWYATLAKPAFSPPNWVFGPAWTVLFALMGISLYLIYRSKKKDDSAYLAFAAQFALNILWSFAFFGAYSPFYGLVVIALLWLAIAYAIFRFYQISKTAAYLLIPYLLWVSFAAVLNYSVFVLNS